MNFLASSIFLAQVTTPEVQVQIPSVTIPSVFITLIVAAVCGALAQLLIGYTRGGCLASLAVGVVGAILGNLIAVWLNMPNILFIEGVDIVWTMIGSAILVAVLSLVRGNYRSRR